MFEDLIDTIGSLEPGNLILHLRALEAERRRNEAELALVVAAIDRQGVHRTDGHASVRGLLRAELAWSDGDALHTARLAKLVTEQPQVGAALYDGVVGAAQARVLARARAHPRCGDQLADHLGLLLGHAASLPFDDFALCVRRWEQLADADGAHRRAEATHTERTASFTTHDGVGRLTATGGSLEGAEMQEIWQRFCDAELASDWAGVRAAWGDAATPALLPRTDPQRRWDALLQVFRAAASTAPDARRPEPTVNIVVDLATFEATLARLGLAPAPCGGPPRRPMPLPIDRWRCETTGGVFVDPVAAVAAAFQGHVRRVVFDSEGTVVDLGRRRRLFTDGAREAVRLQANRCVWPGCPIATGRCQTDHVQDWQHQGTTTPGNGAPLCGRHNRYKTRGYRIWRDPQGRWHTYRPDGSEIGSPPTVEQPVDDQPLGPRRAPWAAGVA